VTLDFSPCSIQRKDGEGGRLEAQPLSFNLPLSECFLIAITIPTRKIRITPRMMPAMAPFGTAGPEVLSWAVSLPLSLLVVTEADGEGMRTDDVACWVVIDSVLEVVVRGTGLEIVDVKDSEGVEESELSGGPTVSVLTGLRVGSTIWVSVTVNVKGPEILSSPAPTSRCCGRRFPCRARTAGIRR